MTRSGVTDVPSRSEASERALATAVIYLRVSTKEQAQRDGDREGYSIPAQRDACRRKATALEAAVVEEFADRGESARSADRPELQRLLAYVRSNHVDYVIVHKVDRLARNRRMTLRSRWLSEQRERRSCPARRTSTRHRAASCSTAS